MAVESDDTGLVRLGNVCENNVDHSDEHTVLHGVTGILNDGDNVGALLSHVDELTSGTVRELDGVDTPGGSNDISDVRDGSTGSGSDVENLSTRLDVDVVQTSKDTGGNLGSEGVPDTVLDLGGNGLSVLVGSGGRGIDRDALLSVDGLTGCQVAGHQHVLLGAGNEDTLVTVLLDDDLGSSASSSTGTTAGSSTGSSASSTSTGSSSTSTTTSSGSST
jgi:hypothetical protein